jgi:hypothetical protein
MTLLSRIFRKLNSNVSFFPIAESSKSKLFSDKTSNEAKVDLALRYDEFEGIFDSAPVGMWLLGQDPRNHKGNLRRFIDLEESFIQPGAVSFIWDEEDYLQIISNGRRFSLFNLHIHSKELKYFGTSWERHLQKAVQESQSQKKKSKLLINIFVRSAYAAFMRRFILFIKKFVH